MRRSLLILCLCAAGLAFGALDVSQDVPPTLVPAGSSVEGPAGTWTVQGAGADIWGTSDQFHYRYDSGIVSGDFAIKCRVASFATAGNVWGKAGIMARVPTNPDAPRFIGPEAYVFNCATIENGTCLQYRNSTGVEAGDALDAGTGIRWQTGPFAPHYIMLLREGDTFTAYASPDGFSWIVVGTHSMPSLFGAPMHVGLAVTSHQSGALATAVFEEVDFDAQPLSPESVIDLTCTVADTDVDLDWMNAAFYNEIRILRRDISGNTVLVTTLPGSSTSFTDAPGNGIWTYLVVAIEEGRPTPAATCSATVATEGAGFLDGLGFFRSWLILGPLARPGGAAPPPADLLLDYLANEEGTITEESVLPVDGDTVFPDFGGNAPLTTAVQGPAGPTGEINPGALSGEAQWYVYHSPIDTINHNVIEGVTDYDDNMHYHVAYLTNTGAGRVVVGGVSSDDSVAVLVDNSVVHANSIPRGYGAARLVQDRFPFYLGAGEHRLVVKSFEGGGGSGIRFRLETMDGAPITSGISIATRPTMTAVPMAVEGPSDLVCDVSGFNATLVWTNNDTYTAINVFRRDFVGNLAQIASLGGAATSYTDASAPLGANTYWVVPRRGELSVQSAVCSVNVGAVGVIDPFNGAFRSWLLLGPISDNFPCAPTEAGLRGDYIWDGVITEQNWMPNAGDVLMPDFAAAENATAMNQAGVFGFLGPYTASQIGGTVNPDAPSDGVVYAWTDPDDLIDLDAIYGSGPDYCNAYAVAYLTSTSAQPRLLVGAFDSDDGGAVILNNSYYHLANTCRGVSGWVDRFPFLLPPGESRLMIKCTEEGGGWGFRFRLENPDGTPLTAADGLELRLAPATMTSVPAASSVTATRVLPGSAVIGTALTVTVELVGGTANLTEVVPANFTVNNRGGAGGAGNTLQWTNASGSVTYTVTPNAMGGTFFGYGQESAGAWFVTGGASTMVYPEQIGDWFSVDIADPGHVPVLPSEVEVVDDMVTISTYLGRDIWGTADEFHYVWQTLDADGIYVFDARLDQFDPLPFITQEWSKAGIMFRQNTSQGSPYVCAIFRSDVVGNPQDVCWQWRDAQNGEAAHDGPFFDVNQNRWNPALPALIRVVYNRGTLVGYFAPDVDQDGEPDEEWLVTQPHVLNLDGQSTVLAGLAVTTHEFSAFNPVIAYFSGVSIRDLGDVGVSNLTANFVGDNVNLGWSVVGDVERIMIYRSGIPDTEGFGEELVADLPGTARSYTDVNVPDEAVFAVYRVVIEVGGGTEMPGPSAGATREGYVVFQEGTAPTAVYDGCQDAHIIYFRSEQNEWNTGGHSHIEEGDWTGGHSDHKEILIRFGLPGVATVTQATLWLYYDFQRNTGAMSTDHTSWAYPVLKDWAQGSGLGVDGQIAMPGEVSWQSPRRGEESWQAWDTLDPIEWPCIAPDLPAARSGGAYGPEDIEIDMGVESNELYGFIEDVWVSWDLTEIAQAWASGALPNYGVKITQQRDFYSPCLDYVAGGYNFVSSNNVMTPSFRPVMIIRTEGGLGTRIRVGDANNDGALNIADAVWVLAYLFAQGSAPTCAKAADTNNDNVINIADAINLLQFLFAGGTMTGADGRPVTGASPCIEYQGLNTGVTINGLPYCGRQCTP